MIGIITFRSAARAKSFRNLCTYTSLPLPPVTQDIPLYRSFAVTKPRRRTDGRLSSLYSVGKNLIRPEEERRKVVPRAPCKSKMARVISGRDAKISLVTRVTVKLLVLCADYVCVCFFDEVLLIFLSMKGKRRFRVDWKNLIGRTRGGGGGGTRVVDSCNVTSFDSISIQF